MAFSSKCPKCEGTFFEIKELNVQGTNYKHNAIQCTKCGTVVTVVDFFNNGQQLVNLKKDVEKIENGLTQMQNLLMTVLQKLGR